MRRCTESDRRLREEQLRMARMDKYGPRSEKRRCCRRAGWLGVRRRWSRRDLDRFIQQPWPRQPYIARRGC